MVLLPCALDHLGEHVAVEGVDALDVHAPLPGGVRAEAFEAARYLIDTLKTTVPIWKKETWQGGVDWGLGAHDVSELAPPDAPGRPADERS